MHNICVCVCVCTRIFSKPNATVFNIILKSEFFYAKKQEKKSKKEMKVKFARLKTGVRAERMNVEI